MIFHKKDSIIEFREKEEIKQQEENDQLDIVEMVLELQYQVELINLGGLQ